jgi:hypothetical protein
MVAWFYEHMKAIAYWPFGSYIVIVKQHQILSNRLDHFRFNLLVTFRETYALHYQFL